MAPEIQELLKVVGWLLLWLAVNIISSKKSAIIKNVQNEVAKSLGSGPATQMPAPAPISAMTSQTMQLPNISQSIPMMQISSDVTSILGLVTRLNSDLSSLRALYEVDIPDMKKRLTKLEQDVK